jgi:hypothetical protein
MPAAANHIAGVNNTRMIPIEGPAYPGKGGAFAPHIFVRIAVRGLSSQFPAEIHRDMPRRRHAGGGCAKVIPRGSDEMLEQPRSVFPQSKSSSEWQSWQSSITVLHGPALVFRPNVKQAA